MSFPDWSAQEGNFNLTLGWGPFCLKNILAGLLLCRVSITGQVCWERGHGCCRTPVAAQDACCFGPSAFINIKANSLISFSLSLNWLWICAERTPLKQWDFGIVNTAGSTRAAFCKLQPANQSQAVRRGFYILRVTKQSFEFEYATETYVANKSQNTIWRFTEKSLLTLEVE